MKPRNCCAACGNRFDVQSIRYSLPILNGPEILIADLIDREWKTFHRVRRFLMKRGREYPTAQDWAVWRAIRTKDLQRNHE